MTLLEKAQSVQSTGTARCLRTTDEHVELALAFLQGQITEKQFAAALGVPPSNGSSNAWGTLRAAVRDGRLKTSFTRSDAPVTQSAVNGGTA